MLTCIKKLKTLILFNLVLPKSRKLNSVFGRSYKMRAFIIYYKPPFPSEENRKSESHYQSGRCLDSVIVLIISTHPLHRGDVPWMTVTGFKTSVQLPISCPYNSNSPVTILMFPTPFFHYVINMFSLQQKVTNCFASY